MRAYGELSLAEQGAARNKCLQELLEAIISGAVRFNDKLNRDDLQARIDAARQDAEKMQTPWFQGEYIMDAAGKDLRSMAVCDAEDALYPGDNEHIIRL